MDHEDENLDADSTQPPEGAVSPALDAAIQQAVSFDCDSTLATIEGIDELADQKGLKKRVEALTQQAMEGGMDFGQALRARLDLIQPSQEEIEAIGQAYRANQVAGMSEVINDLRDNGVTPLIVSGGFHAAILPLAEELGIAVENVLAIRLKFKPDGSYAGIDTDDEITHALMQPNGKARALEVWEGRNRNTSIRVHLGDGATDVEARTANTRNKLFALGFGGVVRRQKVINTADGFANDVAGVKDWLTEQGLIQQLVA